MFLSNVVVIPFGPITQSLVETGITAHSGSVLSKFFPPYPGSSTSHTRAGCSYLEIVAVVLVLTAESTIPIYSLLACHVQV